MYLMSCFIYIFVIVFETLKFMAVTTYLWIIKVILLLFTQEHSVLFHLFRSFVSLRQFEDLPL